jgi:chromate transporter
MRGLVNERGWLSHRVLLDAVAAGQVTPGPVFTTATFIGYVLRGGAGAAVATVAIFAPSFALVWLLAPLLRRLAQSRLLRGFLDGVSAGSLGLMAAAAVALGWQVDREPVAIGVSLLALLLGAGWAVNPSLLLLLGAAVGAVQQLLR